MIKNTVEEYQGQKGTHLGDFAGDADLDLDWDGDLEIDLLQKPNVMSESSTMP